MTDIRIRDSAAVRGVEADLGIGIEIGGTEAARAATTAIVIVMTGVEAGQERRHDLVEDIREAQVILQHILEVMGTAEGTEEIPLIGTNALRDSIVGTETMDILEEAAGVRMT